MSQLLVIGSTGQLAQALRRLRPEAVFLDREALDLAKPEMVSAVLERYAPSAVGNAAAYTQVDNAEKEEALATTINAETPAAMASWCAAKNIPFVAFSTDYVFDGSGDAAWREDDAQHPLSAYGRSKAEMEKRILQAGGKYLLFRTSWVYDSTGKNFPNTILRLAGEREELRVIDDQFGAPTFASHLAKAVLQALETAMAQPVFPSGIYHLCNAGVTTWHGFASAVVKQAQQHNVPLQVKQIHPIPATEYPLPAKRPANSRLDCTKVNKVLKVTMPSWEEGVSECIREKYERH